MSKQGKRETEKEIDYEAFEVPHPPSNPADFDAWAATLGILDPSVLEERETEKETGKVDGKGNSDK